MEKEVQFLSFPVQVFLWDGCARACEPQTHSRWLWPEVGSDGEQERGDQMLVALLVTQCAGGKAPSRTSRNKATEFHETGQELSVPRLRTGFRCPRRDATRGLHQREALCVERARRGAQLRTRPGRHGRTACPSPWRRPPTCPGGRRGGPQRQPSPAPPGCVPGGPCAH